MAKYRKKIKTKVTKAIEKYHRVKISKCVNVYLNSSGFTINGSASAYALDGVITDNSSAYQTMGKDYTMVKLRGVLLECSPWHVTGQGSFVLACMQSLEANNYGVGSQPNCMVCSGHQVTRKYIKIDGPYESTSVFNTLSNLKVGYQVIGSANSETHFYFLLKITLYLTFKSNM